MEDIHSKRVLPIAVESNTICWYGLEELPLEFDVEGGGLSRRWQRHCILTAEKDPLPLDFHSL